MTHVGTEFVRRKNFFNLSLTDVQPENCFDPFLKLLKKFFTKILLCLLCVIVWATGNSSWLGLIVDLACNLVRILDCDFIASRAFNGSKFRQDHCRIADFASNLGGSADLYIPIHPPPPPPLLQGWDPVDRLSLP